MTEQNGVYRDSISRCGPQDDIYSLIRNPYAPQIKKAQAPVDTIEVCTPEQMLEKEAMAKLKEGRLGLLSNDKMLVIARAGRLLFILITLPPYIFLYGIPKWLMMEAIPWMFLRTKTFFQKTVDFSNQILTKIWESVKLNLTSRFSSGLQTFAEYMKWVNKSMEALFTHLQHQVVQLNQKFTKPFKDAYELLEGVVKESLAKILQGQQKIKEKIQSLIKSIQNSFQLGQERLHHSLMQPMQQWTSQQVERIASTLKHIENRTSAFGERLYAFVALPIKKVAKFFEKSAQKITQKIQEFVVKPLVEWAQPKIDASAKFLRKVQNRVEKTVSKHIENIQKKISATAEFVHQSVQPLVNWGFMISQAMIKFITPDFFLGWLRSKASQGWSKKNRVFAPAFARLGNHLKKGVQNKWHQFKQKGKSLKTWAIKVVRWIIAKILEAPGQLWNLMIKLFYAFLRAVRQTVHFLKLTWMWTRVLSRYGAQLLRELADEMGNWMRG